jgi:hypothetical protein
MKCVSITQTSEVYAKANTKMEQSIARRPPHSQVPALVVTEASPLQKSVGTWRVRGHQNLERGKRADFGIFQMSAFKPTRQPLRADLFWFPIIEAHVIKYEKVRIVCNLFEVIQSTYHQRILAICAFAYSVFPIPELPNNKTGCVRSNAGRVNSQIS